MASPVLALLWRFINYHLGNSINFLWSQFLHLQKIYFAILTELLWGLKNKHKGILLNLWFFDMADAR